MPMRIGTKTGDNGRRLDFEAPCCAVASSTAVSYRRWQADFSVIGTVCCAVISAVTARRADSISDVRVSHLLARVPLPSRPLQSSHPIPCILSPLLFITSFPFPCVVPSVFYPVVSVVYVDLLHCLALSLSFTALRPMFVAPRQPYFQNLCVTFIPEPNFEDKRLRNNSTTD